MTLSDKYFVRRRGKVEGPWDVDRVKSEVKLRKLSRIHEISEDGKNWQRADKFSWLFPKKDIVDSAAVFQDSPNSPQPSVSQPPVAGTYNNEPPVAEPYIADPTLGQTSSAETGGWYLAIDGREVGAMSEIDVLQKINEQVVGPLDLAWCTGLPDWTQLQLLPEFNDCFRDPVTGRQKTDLQPAHDPANDFADYERTPNDLNSHAISTLAIFSLVAGILALPLVAFGYNSVVLSAIALVVGVFAFVAGLFAMDGIAKANGSLGGKGIAIAGAIIGVLAAIVAVIFLSLLVVQMIQAPEVTSG